MTTFEYHWCRKYYTPEAKQVAVRANGRRAMEKRREWARANGICERCFKEPKVKGQRRGQNCIDQQTRKKD